MSQLETIHFADKVEFRNWLENNYNKSKGIWMLYYKKHTDVDNISYEDALDEALCFGWIDSTLKRVDDEKYLRKFTPRTNTKNWSDVNKRKVTKLIVEGRMTDAGLNKIDIYLKTGKVEWEYENNEVNKKKEFIVPDFVINEFSKNEPALTNFKSLAKSHQRNYIMWITSAKRDETIQKRIQESIELLKANKILGMK